jgi:hypothetical protein
MAVVIMSMFLYQFYSINEAIILLSPLISSAMGQEV